MINPAISVVVPIYNVERYIKICIDSILAQTFQDFEVIIVDDASPDNSYEICKKLYGGNEKVRIIRHEKNQGLGPARNTGIENARGKYIYFVDSDDAILPKALEILYNVAEQTGADVVHTSRYYKTLQDDDKPLNVNQFSLEKYPYQKEGFLNANRMYRLERCWRHWNDADGIRAMAWLIFCRKEILQKFSLRFEPIISEDELFSFEIMTYVKKFFVLRRAVYVHRIREGSIMTEYNYGRMEKAIQTLFTASEKMKSVMNNFDELRGNAQIQEHFIYKIFNNLCKNHVTPFFKKGSDISKLNEVIRAALQKTFGDKSTFAQYFFNLSNTLRVQFDNLNAQAGQLYQAYQNLNRQNQSMRLLLREQPAILKIFDEMKSSDKKIFLIGTPQHGNLGDQAIAFAEHFMLKKIFPKYKIVEVPVSFLFGNLGKFFYDMGFEKYVKPDDFIAIIGGGNLGNLWISNEIARRNIIEKFHKNKIVIFPQSIYFTDDVEGKQQLAISQKIYNAHPDLHLMLRDENSFNLANQIFPKIKTYLLPDVVTTLYGITDKLNLKREGILFILRKDKEKVRDDSKVEQLQEFLKTQNIPFSITDTVIKENVYKETREKKLRDILVKIRQSRLVITDRFHGVVFSYITRTPVMAFKSFDTKISSGIKWFKNLPSIYYAENENFDDMKKFILQAYNQNLPVETSPNFMSQFAKVMHVITATNGKADLMPLNNTLTIDNIEIRDRAIIYRYKVTGYWKKFFNSRADFFIEYSENISGTPKNIAVIPLLCNFLPIAWVFNAQIFVDELDKNFYDNLNEIKRGYAEMYPRIKFGGKLIVKNLVENNYDVSNRTAAFFSGGVDSFDTLITHADEHPTLVTLWGADVKLDDVEGWNNVKEHSLETAEKFGCKNLLVKSSFRYVINEGVLTREVKPLSGDGWWHGFQHGIAIIGHTAPYVYKHKLQKIYVASSYTVADKGNYTCASDPTIDNYVKIGRCETVHDAYEFNRQEKIHRICEYKHNNNVEINLRVCWQSRGGKNCCACEKCYRTILEILAEGENPAQFGFERFPELLDKMKADLQSEGFFEKMNFSQLERYSLIRNRLRENPLIVKKFELEWFMKLNFSKTNN